MGSLVSLEVGCRRLLEIVESHSRGLDFVDWQKAKHFGGTQNPMDLVPAELRAYARRMDRVDDDGRSRRFMATDQATIPGGGAAAGAVVGEGLPRSGDG